VADAVRSGDVYESFARIASPGGLFNLKRAQLELATESHPAPWRACGQKLYDDDGLFACRHCHGLAYASQPQSPRDCSISWARKIRMQLGGGQASSIHSPTSLAGCTGALTIGYEREHRHQRHTRIAF